MSGKGIKYNYVNMAHRVLSRTNTWMQIFRNDGDLELIVLDPLAPIQTVLLCYHYLMMTSHKKLPFDHTKLLNVPYIQLLEYAVGKALDDKRFTKEEVCQAHPKVAARFDSLAADILSRDPDGTYIIKAEMFLRYLSLVSIQDSRRHADRAFLTGLIALTVSLVLLVLRFTGN